MNVHKTVLYFLVLILTESGKVKVSKVALVCACAKFQLPSMSRSDSKGK